MAIVNKTFTLGVTINSANPTYTFQTWAWAHLWSDITSTSFITSGLGVVVEEYRYSEDGVNWSDWMLKSTYDALMTITLTDTWDYMVEIRLTHSSGTKTYTSLRFNGNDGASFLDLSGTVFSAIDLEGEEWNRLWHNLLLKLYYDGIVPKYIKRGEEADNEADYIVFWKVVAYFYALLGQLGVEEIEQILSNTEKLHEHFKQFTMVVDDSFDSTDSTYLANNLIDEFRQRGTYNIFEPKSGTKDIDGELLRLVGANDGGGGLIHAEYVPAWRAGVAINKTSPIAEDYSDIHEQLNVSPETSAMELGHPDYLTMIQARLNNYTSVGELVNVNNGTVSGVDGIVLSNPTSTDTGIQFEAEVSDLMGYTLDFWCSPSTTTAALTVRMAPYLDATPVSLLNMSTGAALTNEEVMSAVTFHTASGVFFIRLHIYPSTASNDAALLTPAIGQGTQGRFGDTANKLRIEILNDGTSNGDIGLFYIRMYPSSFGDQPLFVNNPRHLSAWILNDNKEVDEDFLFDHIQRYLLPVGTSVSLYGDI